MKTDLINKAKNHFKKSFQQADPDILLYEDLPTHVKECEKWAKRVLELYPEADKEVVLTSVWLHDIGQAFPPKEKDHAIKSETETLKFLKKQNINKDKANKIAHIARSHRNKDVPPQTTEAKILVAADSASHMTDYVYIKIIKSQGKKYALSKLERDFRDVSLLPKLKEDILPLYTVWKELIEIYP